MPHARKQGPSEAADWAPAIRHVKHLDRSPGRLSGRGA
jgi:hypothetical protein